MKWKVFRPSGPLREIAPSMNDDVIRWPNGEVWIPELIPPQRSGLFGSTTQADWQNHAMAAAAQVSVLARAYDTRTGQE